MTNYVLISQEGRPAVRIEEPAKVQLLCHAQVGDVVSYGNPYRARRAGDSIEICVGQVTSREWSLERGCLLLSLQDGIE